MYTPPSPIPVYVDGANRVCADVDELLAPQLSKLLWGLDVKHTIDDPDRRNAYAAESSTGVRVIVFDPACSVPHAQRAVDRAAAGLGEVTS